MLFHFFVNIGFGQHFAPDDGYHKLQKGFRQSILKQFGNVLSDCLGLANREGLLYD